ncbi:hypothetical protein ACEPAH_4045 [Sanghuangporus vaninii]
MRREKIPGKGTVDVTQFASMLDSLRNTRPLRADGARNGPMLFSGNLFAPSVESSGSRRRHMVPVNNELALDVAVTDEATSEVPGCLREYYVIRRCGVLIGFIGLVERWIATVPSWPLSFRYKDMAEVALDLSKHLRDPNGDHRCDLIIALTPNDIFLAKKIKALLPGRQPKNFASTHGADPILGGYDHFHYMSRGIISREDFCAEEETLGSKLDKGDVVVVKRGTHFRGLTELVLELEDASTDSIRQKRPLKASEDLDLRSEVIRTGESASGNWFDDVIHHAYGDVLREMGIQGVHGVLLCAGALRGDTDNGNVTVCEITEIFPFDDSIVAIGFDGLTIWEAFEAGLSHWPTHEGNIRFPVVSGFCVEWDSRKTLGQRVVGVALSSSPPTEQIKLDG